MNVMTRDEIFSAAQTLPPAELQTPVEELLDLAESQEPPHDREWVQTWAKEAHRRAQEVDEGEVTMIPADEVLAGVRAIVRS